MKYWPGYIPPQGDNPPWNAFSAPSNALSLADIGSTGATPSAADLKALITEDNTDSLDIQPTISARIAHAKLRTDIGRILNIHGVSVRVSDATPFSDPDTGIIAGSVNHLFHRCELVAGLAGHNTTGNPNLFTMTEIPELIDSQEHGALAATLTDAAKTFAATDTGLCEVGFQIGEEHHGVLYPGVVDSIAVVTDRADIFIGLEIYKSMDGNVWFPVDKAQYSANGWQNGEYYAKEWREIEVGDGSLDARVIAFAQPEIACFFKVVFDNAAGYAIEVNEVYGFNHQGDVGFSSDLVHYRKAIASKMGNLHLYNLATLPVYRIGAGPVTPSGGAPVLSESTGVWSDPGSLSWYDSTLSAWVKSDGTIYNATLARWESASGASGDVLPLEPLESTELNTKCRSVLFDFRPFNPVAVSMTSNEDLYLLEFDLFVRTNQLNTANSSGVMQNHATIPCKPGEASAPIIVRIYNNGNSATNGLIVWIDPCPQLALDRTATRAGDGSYVSMVLPDENETELQLADALQSITACKNVLNAAHTGVGSLGDTSFEMIGVHTTEDDANKASSPDATDAASSYTLLNELKDCIEPHCSDTDYHEHADIITAIAAADASDEATAVALANELKADINTHLSRGNLTTANIHAWADTQNAISTADATNAATAITLANAIKAAWNAHLAAAINDFTEVASESPGSGEYHINYSTGVLTSGTPFDQMNGAIRFYYMAEGSATTQISENGSTWVSCPSVLTFSGNQIPVGAYAQLKVRSNLVGYTDERDRPTLIIARFSYAS